ncbi:MAG TPA: type IV pili twitching motility protein PilT [Candidatus Pacebacteria bacterium]|nr:MAG: twitching motility protein [Microgenomates group bacterium GW2011_GWB1_45_17]KKU24125.1 MAG: twitching motility protein [Microgenomates group bacterium GW2011_GWC1_46_15]KKU24840.1 MAG: twitching motility protein [Microgenomates group bacterium GW2011_GWA1_46_15]HAV14786.1 type IV pili twitching motility protein PilT [Candidatus Paceibacterota bacterium]HCR11177.1 type IV pili twitching motility protein PilT [Candidatus Paceibacterota bacterium]
MDIQTLLGYVVQQGASDLHLIASMPPTLRMHGVLMAIPQLPALSNEEMQNLIDPLLAPEQKEQLKVNMEVDLSYQYGKEGRFRINVYHQRGVLAAALRLIPSKIKTIEELHLPAICHELTKLRQGLVLIVGPTGHGKSSTLAAMIDEINQTRSENILTIEDPIEFVYPPAKSMVSQRELHADTHSWEVALKSALREDPDVVLVGEMRDYETIAATLTVAETGHLVFTTLHTNSAAQTIDRIIDVFPATQQAQVRSQLAMSLQAVVSQRLLPNLQGGRSVATEILVATSAVRNLIREGKAFQLDNVIQTSLEFGMMSLESSLAQLVQSGQITLEKAQEYAMKQDDLAKFMGTGKTVGQ